MRRLLAFAVPLAVAVPLVAYSGDAPPATEPAFTDSFNERDADLVSRGTNPYFVLEPGFVLVLEGAEHKSKVHLEITVLDETKKIGEVETRVVEERESEDGELAEVSRNYFAISKRTNNVYYFGEDVDTYEDGKVKGHGGSWIAGKDGARYGLMMAGTPLLGARYMQEVAPKVAMDRAEIVSVSDTLETPAGKFERCVRAEETTPLEPGVKEFKRYAAGVGLVEDGSLRLVRSGAVKK